MVALGLMYPVIGLLIKLDSPGPIFYRCQRVGLHGKIFDMFKFRTMFHGPQTIGPSVCPQGDPRVTAVGRVLRRLKLNEFPQFINLLKGDMTLVGPRPEAPDLASLYPPEAQKIFSVKPGLIGPNQILGRNEEELYPPGVQPQEFYLKEILPKKLPLDLQYIEDRSLLKNFKYLILGIWVTVTGAIGRRHLWDNRSQILLLGGDAAFCLLSLAIAHLLRFDGLSQELYSRNYLYSLLPWAVITRLPVFIGFGFYYVLIRHLSFYDIKLVIKGVALSSALFIVVAYFLGLTAGYPRGVFIIDWFGLTTLLVGYRALLRKLYLRYKAAPAATQTKIAVLIWGAGDCGELCLRFLQKEQSPSYEVIGFIDDAPEKRGKRLGGVKILGDRHHLKIIAEIYKIEQIFIAVANASHYELTKIMNKCIQAGLQPRIFLEKCLAGITCAPAMSAPIIANGYSHSVAINSLAQVANLKEV